MKLLQLTGLTDDFGRSNFAQRAPSPTRSQKWLIMAFLCFFVLVAFVADSWPGKKTYFYFAYGSLKPGTAGGIWFFNGLNRISPAMRYSGACIPGMGGSGFEHQSLVYLSSLKLFAAVIPSRLLCLRVLSIFSGCVALFFLYKFSVILFCRPVALLFTFLLVTSPIHIESMRSFSFLPLTNMVAAITCYLLAASLNDKKVAVKFALLSLSCLFLLSLYIAGTLIIILIIGFFILYLRTEWRKLVVFLLFFVGLILLLDIVFGEPRFDIKTFFLRTGEAEWIDDTGDFSAGKLTGMLKNVPRNFKELTGYLLNFNRIPFADEDNRSRLFNIAYTPFLFLGFSICLGRRKKSNIFLILFFMMFFIPPILASDYMLPKRILIGIYPAYLMIALGLWFAFQILSRIFPSAARRSKVAAFSIILLGFVGGYDIYEFLFRVAKPYHNYSSNQLETVARFILGKADQVDWICYPSGTQNLIWGNPYFTDHPESLASADKIHRRKLREVLDGAVKSGESVLYLYNTTFPDTRNDRGWLRNQHAELRSDIEWAKRDLVARLEFSRVPETDLHYALLNKVAGILPESKKKIEVEANLLSAKGVALSASSRSSPDSGADKLVDNADTSLWHITQEEVGSPSWVLVDFGEGEGKIVRSLAALPRLEMPTQFFRHADLLGSTDGTSWERVASLFQKEIPASGEWSFWRFENEKPFRYYKFMIYDGHQSGAVYHFYSMAELAMFE